MPGTWPGSSRIPRWWRPDAQRRCRTSQLLLIYHHGLAGMLGAHPDRGMKWGIGRMSLLSPGHLVASLQHVGSRFPFQISLFNRVNRMWEQPPACCCEGVPDLCLTLEQKTEQYITYSLSIRFGNVASSVATAMTSAVILRMPSILRLSAISTFAVPHSVQQPSHALPASEAHERGAAVQEM
jgi:hypothetical protein